MPQLLEPFSGRLLRPLVNLWRGIVGVGQDYWKDGNWEKVTPSAPDLLQNFQKPMRAPFATSAPEVPVDGKLWHALPGEISEKLWGTGYVTPADEYITELLVTPLGATKEMSLLDLSAGLGGRLLKATENFGVYISGREPDPFIAARGMAILVAAGRSKKVTISAYDPMDLVENRMYDCVISRETIYRVPDKAKFISSISSYCKSGAQVSFTDYIVNPEYRDQPAIKAWCAFEKGASPPGLIEMAELWAKAGIALRIHDDQTAYYKAEIKKGLIRFVRFMSSGVKPDAPTKKAIEKRIATWAHRMAAIESGMRFYRFYGMK